MRLNETASNGLLVLFRICWIKYVVSSGEALYRTVSNSCKSTWRVAGAALRMGSTISKMGGRLSKVEDWMRGTSACTPFDHMRWRAGCSHSLTKIKNNSGVSL